MHTPEEEHPDGAGRLLCGRYRVTQRLGRGGMGVVCRAHDEVLGRDVAVKELRTFPDAAPGDLADFRLRMQREARAAARIRHAGVVAVHDITEHEGRPVIVMELVDGPSMDDVLRRRGTLGPTEAAAVGAKVLDALAAAHRAGVLHRDVKPGNILLAHDGRAVLTDFGIAAVEDPGDGAATHLTRSGELVGSLDYLAPERARGEEPGPASDVWSLGATLYAAVEGSSPFRRTSTWSTLNAIVTEQPADPRNAGALEPALRTLLEKDPARRPDAAAAADLLRRVAEADPAPGGSPDTVRLVGPRPAESGHQVTRPSRPGPGARLAGHDTDRGTVSTGGPQERGRRRPAVAAAVVAALLVGAGIAWGSGALGMDGEGGSVPASAASQVQEQRGQDAPAGEEGGAKAGEGGSRPEGPASPSSGSGQRSDAPVAPGEKAPDDPGPGRAAAEDAGGATGSDGDSSGDSGGGTGDGSGGGSGGSSGSTEPDPVCRAIGGGTYNCQVWRTADSYDAQHRAVGKLYSGTNYFYCQQDLAHRETYGQWTNTWWARTDDDSGHTGVWVSVVYIQGGGNDAPVPGLPTC
ncbi:serine/threonine-protein kinase [Streptomyces sp. TR02-1]|uniref:serine/threonine-protein kinase n=1 Tax=Streptomyces sp. TR02-1 TaxID=3385977 RepID=UPI0039A08A4E